ncbi:MAG: nucleotidyltransferase domain-containing protein, partial [Desulfobacterales bacterium]|nr:nucleotidyltransferase domain-containing protein [Desulfobacterales bacterium]
MEEGIKKIAEELKKRIKKKYKLQDIRVFGSSARGEQRKDSDIDVFVHLDHSDRHV